MSGGLYPHDYFLLAGLTVFGFGFLVLFGRIEWTAKFLFGLTVLWQLLRILNALLPPFYLKSLLVWQHMLQPFEMTQSKPLPGIEE